MSNPDIFADQIVWVTGASSGIGEALAIELAGVGARIVLSARREDELERVRLRLKDPEKHLVLPLDVTAFDSHADCYRQIREKMGPVDVLIANAGVDQRSRALRTDPAVERRIMDVNYFGAISLMRAVFPDMRMRNRGQIVAVSSVMGHLATPLHSSYAASKHALHGYMESLRAELFGTGIDCTILCPGYIKTPISVHALRWDGSEHGKMDRIHSAAMSADIFARRAVRAIRKRKAEVYIGGPEILTIYARRFFPRLVRLLMPRLYFRVIGEQKTLEKVENLAERRANL